MTKNDVDKLILWIKEYFANNNIKGAVIGMSGGKDSLVVAKLLTNAIGNENVVGLIMPNGEMMDIDDATYSCKYLKIKHYVLNIENSVKSILENTKSVLKNEQKELTTVTTYNTPPRVRMATLYAVAGSLGYVVANTSNLSEAMVGYTTKWGDNVGDIAPIANFTKEEVCEIGLLLGLPRALVLKTPSDGLTGKSDEDSMGIKYGELGEFIRNGTKSENFEKILKLHKNSAHKRTGAVKFDSGLKNYFDDEQQK